MAPRGWIPGVEFFLWISCNFRVYSIEPVGMEKGRGWFSRVSRVECQIVHHIAEEARRAETEVERDRIALNDAVCVRWVFVFLETETETSNAMPNAVCEK